MTIDLTGKKAAVFGVANEKSIAWHIASKLDAAGCRMALGYQDRVKETVLPLIKKLNNPIYQPCDLRNEEDIESFFKMTGDEFGSLDIIIHSVAFAKRADLKSPLYELSEDGYTLAQKVSSFSLPLIIKSAEKLLKPESSVIAMTYAGSQKAIPNYSVMGVCKASLEAMLRYLALDLGERGIRVNGISAGPVETLAASGIEGFDKFLNEMEEKSLLHRNIDYDDIANCALFLSSEMSKNITGQIIYVDAGFNVSGI